MSIVESTFKTVEHTPQRIAVRLVDDRYAPWDDTTSRLYAYGEKHGLHPIWPETFRSRKLTEFLSRYHLEPTVTYVHPGWMFPKDEHDERRNPRRYAIESSVLMVDLPPEKWPSLDWWRKNHWGTFITAELKPLEAFRL